MNGSQRFLGTLCIVLAVMPIATSRASIVYSEDFDGPGGGSDTSAYGYTQLGGSAPFYSVGTSNIGTGNALTGNNNVGAANSEVHATTALDTANTDYTLTANIWAPPPYPADPNGTSANDSFFGLRYSGSGSGPFNNSTLSIGTSGTGANNTIGWFLDGRGVDGTTDVQLGSFGQLLNTVLTLTIQLDHTGSYTASLTDGVTTLSQTVTGVTLPAFDQIFVQNYLGGFQVDNILLQTTPVPEPSTLALVGIGAVGLFLGRRNRWKSRR